MQVQNAQVEEPKIVEEARNKQKEKRSEALEKERLFFTTYRLTFCETYRVYLFLNTRPIRFNFSFR